MMTPEDNWPAILRQSIREDWHLTDEAKEQLAAYLEKAIIADEHRMAALIVKALGERDHVPGISNYIDCENINDVVIDGHWDMIEVARSVLRGMLVDVPPESGERG